MLWSRRVPPTHGQSIWLLQVVCNTSAVRNTLSVSDAIVSAAEHGPVSGRHVSPSGQRQKPLRVRYFVKMPLGIGAGFVVGCVTVPYKTIVRSGLGENGRNVGCCPVQKALRRSGQSHDMQVRMAYWSIMDAVSMAAYCFQALIQSVLFMSAACASVE